MRQQFDSLRASSLYCKKCQKAMPVRERLLLILPGKEIFDYCCQKCGESVGQREVTQAERLTQPGGRAPVPGQLFLP